MTDISAFIQLHPVLWQALKLVFTAIVSFVVLSLILWLERRLANRLFSRKNNINLRFVESIVRFILIFLAIQWVMMSSPLTESFGKMFFQGTAVLAAIAGFAAQPVIADMICGLILSVTKPFDIGDRIELDDGTAGIVKDITLRHITLQDIDTVIRIIPNSKMNEMKITNMSYGLNTRSIHMRFHVAYDTEVKKAIEVISRAVQESPWSIPGKPGNSAREYGPVYFFEYAASSLVMATTVYFAPSTPAEVLRSDINIRVNNALKENGIEIPYEYVNVVMNSPEK